MDNTKKEELFKQWEIEFYDKFDLENELYDADFESIAFGFFIAKGCTLGEARKMYQHCIIQGKF